MEEQMKLLLEMAQKHAESQADFSARLAAMEAREALRGGGPKAAAGTGPVPGQMPYWEGGGLQAAARTGPVPGQMQFGGGMQVSSGGAWEKHSAPDVAQVSFRNTSTGEMFITGDPNCGWQQFEDSKGDLWWWHEASEQHFYEKDTTSVGGGSQAAMGTGLAPRQMPRETGPVPGQPHLGVMNEEIR